MDNNEKPATRKPTSTGAHIEDVMAPIIYADFCVGGGPMNGDNITLTFTAKILDHRQNPPITLTKTVGRLVMPRNAMRRTATFINKLLDDLEKGSAPPTNAVIN